MRVKKIPGIGFDSNIYIIDQRAIIDTGTGFHSNYVIEKMKEEVDLREIESIILTHEHPDHCGGAKKMKKICENAELSIHEKGKMAIERGMNCQIFGIDLNTEIIDRELNDGDVIDIGDVALEVIHTPGHSLGSICLYEKNSKSLFSGDTVFSNGNFGRTDLIGSDTQELFKSIKKLNGLDVSNLYPGHGPHVIGFGNEHIEMALSTIERLS